ncbi:MAG: sugar ABC transporter permease, partial [Paracoccaceae bacterium]
VFFYPVMLSPVVVGFLWTLILKRQGVLSQTLLGWGWISEPIQWLTEPGWMMFWSVFVYTWAHLGFYMLILLAGLQAIPPDVYEAAEMDGTPPWRQLTRITLPLLAPTLLVVTVLSLIKAFQAFEELYAMSVRWSSLVAYIFETSGLRGQPTANGLGIAAMASLLVALVLIVLSLLQVWASSRGTNGGTAR